MRDDCSFMAKMTLSKLIDICFVFSMYLLTIACYKFMCSFMKG